MSLEYWFPLTSDLHNQGIASLANASVQSGCSLSSDGKLGGCYKNTGTTSNVATPISFSADQFTLCAWVRIDSRTNGWHRAIGLSGSGTYMGMVCENTNGTSVGFHYYKTIDGTNTSIFDNYPCSPTVGVWYHYAMCYDGIRYYVYLNGNKITDAVANKTNIRAEMTTLWLFGGTSNNYVKDSINDVRIYSHCLSALEIAEIAKGMILHYPMTGGGRGQANLYDFESVVSKWTNEGETSLTNYTDSSYGNVLKISSVANKRIYRSVSNVWTTSGGKYTVSFLAKASTNGATCDMSRSLADYSPTFTLTTNWKKYSGTITLTDTSSSGTLSFRTLSSTDYYITQIKLESGEKATAYLPGVNDSHYNSMGYNDTLEYDLSGNLYNSTINGTVNMNSDTPRYSVCSYFDADANYLSRTEISSDTYAISFWIKFPVAVSSTYRVAFADHLSRLAFGMINATTVCCTCAGNSMKTYTVSQFTVNTWYHIVVQYNSDKSDVLLYINGVAQTNRGNTDSWNHNTTTLMIGRRSTGSTINAYMSDFRIYATVLSEDDILKLYNRQL